MRWGDDVFFCRDFLRIIDNDSLASVTQYYLKVYDHDQLVAGILLQVKKFSLHESLRQQPPASTWLGKLSSTTKRLLARAVNYQVVVVGNLLLTGQYGVRTASEFSSEDTLIELAIAEGVRQLRARGLSLSAVIRKDYEGSQRLDPAYGYTEFTVQPTMYLARRAHWTDLDTYMADMKSKYRVRIRKALQLIEPVDKRIMDLTEIEALEDEIQRLYHYVSEGAGFNMFVLPADYFKRLKTELGDRAEIIGYFLDGQLIGFYSAIVNGDHLDAHFIGYDPAYNRSHQLYLNMLIGLTSLAIDRQLTGIQMSRTAMEIKSSVGAEPTDYYVYLRAMRPWINSLLPRILAYFVPVEIWEQRHPFK